MVNRWHGSAAGILGTTHREMDSAKLVLETASSGCGALFRNGGASPLRPLWVMCGRRRLGKNFLSCCSIGRVRSCVPACLCGHEAAGHNALRGSGPNQKHAFKDALTHAGSPDPRIDLVCITSCVSSPIPSNATVVACLTSLNRSG